MLSLSPDPALTTDDLSVSASGSSDADGDTITYSYQWSVDGSVITHTGTSVPAADTTVGELWSVLVTPNDGYVDGATSSASIIISNSEPQLSAVSISPASGVTNDLTLTCSASGSDADDGSLTPVYEWTVGAVATAALPLT